MVKNWQAMDVTLRCLMLCVNDQDTINLTVNSD